MKTFDLVLLMVEKLIEKDAEEVKVIEVGDRLLITDYFVIASGSSERHVRTLYEWLDEQMSEVGIIPLGVEGYAEGRWILMDYGDIIVHIFLPDVRRFYDLEGLWIDMRVYCYDAKSKRLERVK